MLARTNYNGEGHTIVKLIMALLTRFTLDYLFKTR